MSLVKTALRAGAAFLFGYVAARYISKKTAEQPRDGRAQKPSTPAQTVSPPYTPVASPTAVTPTQKTAAKDDLTAIRGIGPTFAKRLHDAGIHTFSALAAQSAAHLRTVTQLKDWQAADPADWIEQAKQFSRS